MTKYNNIRKNYIRYCKNLKILTIIEKYYKDEINYDEILERCLFLDSGSDKERLEDVELLIYLLNKTNKKSIKYNYLLYDPDIQNIIINRKICVEIDSEHCTLTKSFLTLLLQNNLYNGICCTEFYNNIDFIKAFEKNIKYFDSIARYTTSNEVLLYCLNKPLLNPINVLEKIIQNYHINNDIKFYFIKKYSTIDIIGKITDNSLIEKLIDNGYRNFKKFCNNLHIISKYIRLLNVQDLLDISSLSDNNTIVKLCINEGAFNFNDIAKNKNRDLEIVELCVRKGAHNYNEIAANNINQDVIIYCINKGANNYSEILKNHNSEEIVNMCIKKGFNDCKILAGITKNITTLRKCIIDGADNFDEIFGNLIKNHTIGDIFDIANSISNKLNENVLVKIINVLNSDNIKIIFNYKNILEKLIEIKNFDVLCTIIELLSQEDKNYYIDTQNNFELDCYDKIHYICERLKYDIDKIFLLLIERKKSYIIHDSLLLHYAQIVNNDTNIYDFNLYMYVDKYFVENSKYLLFKQFPYFGYILQKYNKYLDVNYLCSELIKNNCLLLCAEILKYGNVNINEVYNKITFKEYKNCKSIHLKYAYNEFYNLILNSHTISPNDIAFKAVYANNVNVLKYALKRGADDIRTLISKCKEHSKVYNLLRKNM